MPCFVRLSLLAGLVAVGCDSGTEDTDGGSGTDAGSTDAGPDATSTDAGPGTDAGWDAGPWDAGPDAGGLCGLDIDSTCPASMPHSGAPCRDGLTCEYPDPNGMWMYGCPAGRWQATSTCTSLGGGCPIPPFAETCDMPVTDTLMGAVVEIGPAGSGPFRPFMDREMISIIFGGQGSPMIEYRIRITRVDAPDCVRAITTIDATLVEPVSEPRTINLRCGESLGILTIVPTAVMCPDTPVETVLTANVTGIGSASVTVLLPAESFCPLLAG